MGTYFLMADIHVQLTAVLPKGLVLDMQKLRAELEGAFDHTMNIIRDDFQKTTKTWEHPVEFVKDGPAMQGGDLAASVSTDDEIYGYVNDGTPAHPIAVRNAKFLAFRWGGPGSYRPKTRVRIISSSAGGPTGETVFRKQVWHPGTTAREFDAEIAKRRQRNFTALVKLAFHRSIASGR